MPLIFRSQEDFEQEVVLQTCDGRGIRFLARTFGISRNTVRRILRRHDHQRGTEHSILPRPPERASKLDVFKPAIKKLLETYPDITGQRLFEELEVQGFTGGITILRDYLKIVRKPLVEPIIRMVVTPGQQGQMDWSPYKINFVQTGKMEVQCFSYVLAHSRRHFIDFTPRHDFFTLIRRHQDAFAHFQGVPKECLYDNEKTVVLRWEAGKPVFNPAFTAFITHYSCRPIACRPRRPQTKGRVEAPFQYIEKNLLGGRTFQDLEDLRAMAVWWMREKSDPHIHNKTKRAPLDLFLAEEQSALRPLPAFPYDTAEVALAICQANGFVRFESNWYSVPTGYLSDLLSVKATEQEILIYSQQLELLVRHERAPRGAGKEVEDPSHHRTKRERYGLEPLREAMLALGPAAEEFMRGLEKRFPRSSGFHARFILALKEQYHSEDIHRALEHALRFQAFEGSAIERILRARAKPRTLEHARNDRARQELAKALPEITQRPLTEYGTLLNSQQEEPDGNDREHQDEDQGASRDPGTDRDTEGSG